MIEFIHSSMWVWVKSENRHRLMCENKLLTCFYQYSEDNYMIYGLKDVTTRMDQPSFNYLGSLHFHH